MMPMLRISSILASWYVSIAAVIADDAARVKLKLSVKHVDPILGVVVLLDIVDVVLGDNCANRRTCPVWHRETAIRADMAILSLENV